MGEPEKSFDQIKYQNAYNKEKYDRITVMVPAGQKEEITARAREHGMSVNGYLRKLINDDMEK